MTNERISSLIDKLIDNAIDTYELFSEETRNARISGLKRNLIEDLMNINPDDMSINPKTLYQHLRRNNAVMTGKNIIEGINTLKELGQPEEVINTFLTTNLPGYDEVKLASTLVSIEKATRK